MDDQQFLPNAPAHTSAACQSMKTGGDDVKCRRVCAIVVTYFPDHDFAGRMRSIGDESDSLIVWDNTPTPGCPSAIEAAMHSPKSTVLRTGENLGIASAVNRAMSWAAVHGFEWAVIFRPGLHSTPGNVAAGVERLFGVQRRKARRGPRRKVHRREYRPAQSHGGFNCRQEMP